MMFMFIIIAVYSLKSSLSYNLHRHIYYSRLKTSDKYRIHDSNLFCFSNAKESSINAKEPSINEAKATKSKFNLKRKSSMNDISNYSEFLVNREKNWLKQWQSIEIMRSQVNADVDSMGASSLAYSDTFQTNPEFRFATLIGCMLSPQTKDKQTSQAFYALKELILPSNKFLPSNILTLSIEDIELACKLVSFYKVKARNIILASQRCVDRFNNDIPENIEELLEFPGVGPKIAYLTFSIAWGKTLGICVDTHVHRISNRLGWVSTWQSKSTGPEKSRLALQEFLPHEKWSKVNGLLVGFGQTICSAVAPKCDRCLLQESCKYYNDSSFMRTSNQSTVMKSVSSDD